MSLSEWTEHSRFSRQGAANHSPGSLRYPNKACEALTSTARGLPCSSLPDRLWTSSADTAVTAAPLCRSVGVNSPPHSKQAGRGCPPASDLSRETRLHTAMASHKPPCSKCRFLYRRAEKLPVIRLLSVLCALHSCGTAADSHLQKQIVARWQSQITFSLAKMNTHTLLLCKLNRISF